MITIHKIKSGYVADATIKGDKLEYFQKGKGWKGTKVFELVTEIEYAKTWREVVEIHDKYGLDVALSAAEYMTAGIVKWVYVTAYVEIAHKITNAGYNMDVFDKCISICRFDYWMALCGIGSFDVMDLDTRINTPDGVSTAEHLARLYGQEIAGGINAGI